MSFLRLLRRLFGRENVLIEDGVPQADWHTPTPLVEQRRSWNRKIAGFISSSAIGVFASGMILGAAPLLLDEVAFPVARHRTGDHLGRAIGVLWGIWPRRSVPRARGRRALRA